MRDGTLGQEDGYGIDLLMQGNQRKLVMCLCYTNLHV